MAGKKLLVDIHTHVYLPRYASVLRSRNSVPLIRKDASTQQERLLILDHEPSGGRPVGPQYWDREGALLRHAFGLVLLMETPYRETQVHGQSWN